MLAISPMLKVPGFRSPKNFARNLSTEAFSGEGDFCNHTIYFVGTMQQTENLKFVSWGRSPAKSF